MAQLAGLGAVLSRSDLISAQERLPTRAIPVSGEALPVVGLGSTKALLDSPT